MFFGGGFFSLLFLPILILLLAGVMIFHSLTMAFSDVLSGGQILYGESAAQDYADAQYREEFGDLYGTNAYEDCLLLVVFTEDENYYEYAYLAWAGYNIPEKANKMLGNNTTALGTAMHDNVAQFYKNSLGINLAYVMNELSRQMQAQNVDFSVLKSNNHGQVKSHLKNETGFAIDAQPADDALQAFTEATGIPTVIVVADAEEAFGRTIRATSIITVGVCLILVAVAVFMIVKRLKAYKNNKGDGPEGGQYDPNNQNGYDAYYDGSRRYR